MARACTHQIKHPKPAEGLSNRALMEALGKAPPQLAQPSRSWVCRRGDGGKALECEASLKRGGLKAGLARRLLPVSAAAALPGPVQPNHVTTAMPGARITTGMRRTGGSRGTRGGDGAGGHPMTTRGSRTRTDTTRLPTTSVRVPDVKHATRFVAREWKMIRELRSLPNPTTYCLDTARLVGDCSAEGLGNCDAVRGALGPRVRQIVCMAVTRR